MKSIYRKSVTDKDLKDNKLLIFGEIHTKEERDEIERLIRRANELKRIKTIISEECGPHIYLTPNSVKRGKEKEAYSNSDRTFTLAMELGLKVIGCDLWDSKTFVRDKKDQNGFYTDCRRSFWLRETFMVDQIMAFANPLDPHGRTVMIVGDSHLRGARNTVMGDASVVNTLPYTHGLIIRSDIGEVK